MRIYYGTSNIIYGPETLCLPPTFFKVSLTLFPRNKLQFAETFMAALLQDELNEMKELLVSFNCIIFFPEKNEKQISLWNLINFFFCPIYDSQSV
jgi:hypothetical protein